MRETNRLARALGLSLCLALGPPAAAQQAAPSAKPATPAAKPAPALEKLKGRWVRSEGGYVIEIRGVGPDGKLDAAYLNPRSIHVARAEATREGGAVQVFVELRDVNYPGSTYTLLYDPASDRLVGRYYQAVARETFDIFFVRQKP
jgi:uncharacterized protein (DUF2147 family)